MKRIGGKWDVSLNVTQNTKGKYLYQISLCLTGVALSENIKENLTGDRSPSVREIIGLELT